MKPETNNAHGDFEGKVVIITGAATGIGLATTKLFASRGALIVAEDINPDVKTVFADNDRIVPFVGDVATEEAAQDVVALAVERFGKLDILVNNAASIVYKNAIDMSLDEWNSIIGISATGVFLHSREALKAMISNKSGAIVNIGSYACYFTFPESRLTPLRKALSRRLPEHSRWRPLSMAFASTRWAQAMSSQTCLIPSATMAASF